jgi:ABC-type glutathione transport system ATPase component
MLQCAVVYNKNFYAVQGLLGRVLMLEIRNLSKEYQTRGNVVKALDNISISFPETGMVFLLGKSGSGNQHF